ncbi:MAG: hypothetical protein NVS2B8_18470 [Vulcanimicrobiaceae bacterium]
MAVAREKNVADAQVCGSRRRPGTYVEHGDRFQLGSDEEQARAVESLAVGFDPSHGDAPVHLVEGECEASPNPAADIRRRRRVGERAARL